MKSIGQTWFPLIPVILPQTLTCTTRPSCIITKPTCTNRPSRLTGPLVPK
ncbi:hypothetical protein HanXRQr2_Chr05g0208721 [Helianthus annuus]|uniref:Uncharacterized protein n=1 Tax=Helianthus annuus TaxID=4232 RepID=A0A9K3NN68_HELAN|nr:hypothetical protein HanXRQr2_Chr05g0208721 [Helianthus annuus]KAJ0569833.1 hypothetical protein HanHA300_Chr05g0171061 [Helianthus annuus]KAJ0584155.1 hypothetical protein HanHA89_Chr05g0185251 [Helianthus annuus]KAJ0749824.1 hypothetical protein HanLR1_Chr05g0174641 [Helianthus annuus]KAJ0922267.1 hypothetical protein HanPSC8_Chr05g0201721 [Helianthus annuus]